jgi:hypothetical protein
MFHGLAEPKVHPQRKRRHEFREANVSAISSSHPLSVSARRHTRVSPGREVDELRLPAALRRLRKHATRT